MTSRSIRTFSIAVGFVVLAFLAALRPAHASDIAYISGGTNIQRWDTGTNTTSLVTGSADGGRIDSLIFDTSGDLIYSIFSTSSIGRYNLTTHSNTVLASGGNLDGVLDMALDPGGATFLVSNFGNGTIDRVNVTTGAKATLYNGRFDA